MKHPYSTIDQAAAIVEREARGLPDAASPHVCQYCFGPKGQAYDQCHGCLCLMRTGADARLLQRVLPISVAEDPGAWYSRMSSYKGAMPDNSYLLAAALFAAMTAWRDQIEGTFAGAVDAICITPSTRGVPLRQQRLAGAVRLIARFLPPIEPLLTAVAGKVKPRNRVDADLFQPTEHDIGDKRILLIEDTWVSGAAAMSAAMALLKFGAKDVLVMPIARRVEMASTQKLHGNGYQDVLHHAPWRASSLPWPR